MYKNTQSVRTNLGRKQLVIYLNLFNNLRLLTCATIIYQIQTFLAIVGVLPVRNDLFIYFLAIVFWRSSKGKYKSFMLDALLYIELPILHICLSNAEGFVKIVYAQDWKNDEEKPLTLLVQLQTLFLVIFDTVVCILMCF